MVLLADDDDDDGGGDGASTPSPSVSSLSREGEDDDELLKGATNRRGMTATTTTAGAAAGRRRGHRRNLTGSFIRSQAVARQETFLRACERDRADARAGLERERKFTVAWSRLSTNRIWSDEEGPPVALFEDSVRRYKNGRRLWPLDRDVDDLSLYGQAWDFFRFMSEHTRPYKTFALIVLMATVKPLQNVAVAYVADAVRADPKGAPVWKYFLPFCVHFFDRFAYWWHEMWIPLNSQRYQLRCALLAQRTRLPDSHDLARKWPAGRFNGLLRDVDELVNGVWGSCLKIMEELVTVFWTTALCLANLATAFARGRDEVLPDPLPTVNYGVYAALFLGLAFVTMALPFLWFQFFVSSLKECETMVRDGQALYLSAADHAVMVDSPQGDYPQPFTMANERREGGAASQKRGAMTSTGKHAFRVFAFSTFRSFFLRLAWSTNYTLLLAFLSAPLTYVLLTVEGFGDVFSVSATLIVLLSLKDLIVISTRLLELLTIISRGCLVLSDVAELLNSKSNNATDTESLQVVEATDEQPEELNEEQGGIGSDVAELLNSKNNTTNTESLHVVETNAELPEEFDEEQSIRNPPSYLL